MFQKTTDIDLVDWNNWGDDTTKDNETELQDQEEISAAELFKDMEPTINKAKVEERVERCCHQSAQSTSC